MSAALVREPIKDCTFNFRLSNEAVAQINALCKKRKVTAATLIRQLIEEEYERGGAE